MASITETKEIEHTPANKWCSNCNKHIKSGSSSIAVSYFDGDFHEAIVCSVECMEEFEKELNNVPDDSEDNEIGWEYEGEDY